MNEVTHCTSDDSSQEEELARRLLEAARAGGPEALGSLLNAWRAYLQEVAERELDSQLRPKDGASDLVQQTFTEAVRDFPKFAGGTPAELQAWLVRILRQNLQDFGRRYRKSQKRQLAQEMPFTIRSLATG